jgi:hypothetical protein
MELQAKTQLDLHARKHVLAGLSHWLTRMNHEQGLYHFLQHRHRDNREARGLLNLSREEEEMNDTRASRPATSPLTLILAPGKQAAQHNTTLL